MSGHKINHKCRVGVFLGGKSIEHEVSFNSGRTVCDHLDTTLYEVTPIYQTLSGELYILPWRFLHRGKTSDFQERLSKEAKKISWDDLKGIIDFAYIAMHGRYAEDGTLQGFFEVLGIPYLGAKVFSSALMLNKLAQKNALRDIGIKVPRGFALRASEIKKHDEKKVIDNVLKELKVEGVSLPVIVKPVSEGSSLGVSAVFDKEKLFDAILFAATCDERRLQDVLIEEKVEGMEFVCVALEDTSGKWETLPVTEVVKEEGTHFFDYEQKYMPGRATKIVPPKTCSREEEAFIQKECLKATAALQGRTITRIDGFFTKDKNVILMDAQPITGMGPTTFLFHQAAEFGMSHTTLINHLIKTDLFRYNLHKNEIELRNDMKVESDAKGRTRVAVLLGGDSLEREISLESGRNVCYKLSPNKYEVIPLFVDEKTELYKLTQKLLVKNSTREIAISLSDEIKLAWSDLPKICDFVFIALHGGKGENGSIQGALEMLGVSYNGSSVLTSSLCMNKYRANQFLKQQGFCVPSSMLIDKKDWLVTKKEIFLEKIEKDIKFPLILKPHNDGCSNFVLKVDDFSALEKGLKEFFASGKDVAMVEELIKAKELTCGVVGNDEVLVLPPSEPIAADAILSIKEKFLPGAGENQTPANISAQATKFVQAEMGEVYKALGCKGYARIDCFYQEAKFSPTGEDRVVILEVNTLPGMTPATCLFHQAAEIGLKPMEFMDKIIELGFENHKSLSRQESSSPGKKSKGAPHKLVEL